VGDGRVPVDHDVLVAHGLPRWSSGIDDGDGDDDQGDEEPEPVASSTSDATGRDARQASDPPVVSVLGMRQDVGMDSGSRRRLRGGGP